MEDYSDKKKKKKKETAKKPAKKNYKKDHKSIIKIFQKKKNLKKEIMLTLQKKYMSGGEIYNIWTQCMKNYYYRRKKTGEWFN